MLERRLGSGSTAVGLLVTDEAAAADGGDRHRVLKVALDDSAASRLEGEAEVLSALNDPHVVRLVAGPARIGGRLALVLERAGDQTLAEVLRERERLSLDMLERLGHRSPRGTDRARPRRNDHRDVKPPNLGVREDRTTRPSTWCCLTSRWPAPMPPRLLPALRITWTRSWSIPAGAVRLRGRTLLAAVVLFEMATGTSPQFGDGLWHPATLAEEAARSSPSMFNSAVAARTHGFLPHARWLVTTKARFDTAAEMLAAWQGCIRAGPQRWQMMPTSRADARSADPQPLADAGLSR